MNANSFYCKTQQDNPPCIWMQAGVVSRKICRINFDCPSCRFDRILSVITEENMQLKREGRPPSGKRGRLIPWKEKLLGLPLTLRPCIHHMKGRIEFRSCNLEYRCGRCDFDQLFNDQYSVHAEVNPVDLLDVDGFKVPQGYYFHTGHAWVKIEEGNSVSVGLDDFALRLLGPFDRIESPLIGKQVQRNQPAIRVTRDENQAMVLSPVSGVVTAVNPELRESGTAAGTGANPYGDGWIMCVQSDDLRQDLKSLMIYDETRAFLKKEVGHLYSVIESVEGPLATDGGYLGQDIYGQMPSLGWDRLTGLFLRSTPK